MSVKARLSIIFLAVLLILALAGVSLATADTGSGYVDLLYAADYNHDLVHVYDVSASSFAKVATISIEKPSVVVASNDGKRVYVASSGSLTSGFYVISTANQTVIARYSLPDDGAGDIGISPDDRYVYVVTATRFIILDTATGKTSEKTIDTDRYTTLTTARDMDVNKAYFAAPGSSELFVYDSYDDAIYSYHLNCEIGYLSALSGTRLLGTDKLGEINILNYNYYTGVEGWSYTPRPVGISSSFFVPYLTVSNDQKTAYFTDRENNRVYEVNLEDFTSRRLVNVSDWESPTRGVFSSDDSKVFICDDTGVLGLYTVNNTQYAYFYGYKATDVDIATVQAAESISGATTTPKPEVVSPSPEPTDIPASWVSPTVTPTATPATTPTLAVLPVIALILSIYGMSRIYRKY
ncbi:YncE family protein [Methanocella arvoryzae]|nr:hypothetical protein [Methanocella arvoryzae]